jgi:hypothetical protein
MSTWTERVLILCKTYPSPSGRYSETSCVAGVTEDGRLIRLFPVPFRLIADDQQFCKWQWISARIEKARDDHRPESHRIFVDGIECEAPPMPAGKDGWLRRMAALKEVPVHNDFTAVEDARVDKGATLAFLRPSRILSLEIKPARSPVWTDQEMAKLTQMQNQASLFSVEESRRDAAVLEKIPFDFYYHYECVAGGETRTYRHKLVDWEVGALYRRLRKQYGASGWEAPFREKYEKDLPSRDLLMLLGTIHRFPDQWLVVSVYSPPKPTPEDQRQGLLFGL